MSVSHDKKPPFIASGILPFAVHKRYKETDQQALQNNFAATVFSNWSLYSLLYKVHKEYCIHRQYNTTVVHHPSCGIFVKVLKNCFWKMQTIRVCDFWCCNWWVQILFWICHLHKFEKSGTPHPCFALTKGTRPLWLKITAVGLLSSQTVQGFESDLCCYYWWQEC